MSNSLLDELNEYRRNAFEANMASLPEHEVLNARPLRIIRELGTYPMTLWDVFVMHGR